MITFDELLKKIQQKDPEFICIDFFDKEFSNMKLDLNNLRDLHNSLKSNEFIGNVNWNEKLEEFDKINTSKFFVLKEKIERKLFENNLKFNFFPSDFLFGTFCWKTQNLNEELFSIDSKNFDENLNEWHVKKVFNISNNNLSRLKFLSVLYGNEIKSQMVLCFKGADFINEIDENYLIESLYISSVFTCIVTFYVVKKYARKFSLSTCGFGFGGFLSKLSSLFCLNHFNKPDVKVVAFDSPGLCKSYENDIRRLEIMSYFSEPNLLNTLNQDLLYDRFKFKKEEGKKDESIETLILNFIDNDKKSSLELITSWPRYWCHVNPEGDDEHFSSIRTASEKIL
jgi:hypothetical protein